MPGPMDRGATAALTRELPSLRRVVLGVGWQTSEPALAAGLVVAALLVDAGGRAEGDDDVVFFNQLSAAGGAVAMSAADVEQVEVDLGGVPAGVDRVVLAVYVDPGTTPRRTLGQLRSLSVRVLDAAGDTELVRSVDLAAGLREETAIVPGALYRNAGGWKFRVVGDAYAGIAELAKDFGVPL